MRWFGRSCGFRPTVHARLRVGPAHHDARIVGIRRTFQILDDGELFGVVEPAADASRPQTVVGEPVSFIAVSGNRAIEEHGIGSWRLTNAQVFWIEFHRAGAEADRS